MKWIENVCFLIIVFFALIGAAVFAITIHEMSHWQDYHEYVDEDGICILNMPTDWSGIWSGPAGYYHFTYSYANESEKDKVKDIKLYTEPKAYTWTVVVMLIFLVMMLVVLHRRITNNLKAKLYDELEESTEQHKSGPD